MSIWDGIVAEVYADHTLALTALAFLLTILARTVVSGHRERLRTNVTLFMVHLGLVPIAGAFRAGGSSLADDVRLAALILASLSLIGLTSRVLFSFALPKVRLIVPQILQDVLIAAASLISIFVLASKAGLNLSGLIATSAVLTAVIGLAFQDTLGNVVGGLALQLDNSVQVGDWIKVGDVSGRVAEIHWRYTAVETRNWETVIVPNALLVKGQVVVQGRRGGVPSFWRRWVYFNVDFRYAPSDVTRVVNEALRGTRIERVADEPKPECIIMDLAESTARYAVRYWLTDVAVDDPTDSVIRTRIYFALRRAGIPLSMPAHAVFLTEDSSERKEQKEREEEGRRMRALSRVELFSHLSDEERTALATRLRHAPFGPGETMTRQGAEAHWLYMIVEGDASVRIATDGRQREVATLHSGDFFGEMSLLTGEKRTATVIATTPVECYRLDKAAFQSLLSRRPELAERIAEILAKRRNQLGEVREGKDDSVQLDRVSSADLLGKIRRFFAIED
jgi:small-conductance mechanosensitive channel/CRP-like cAMP-binding protein